MLTKNQFDILNCIYNSKDKLTQRQLSNQTKLSLGSINKSIKDFLNNNLIDNNYHITQNGLDVLEPYRVKKAVIIAAGLGSRLIPVTLSTPKPLVRVKGERMIDSTLNALKKVGIDEIYIVRGYLKQQFNELLIDYPNIKFIDNDKYNEANNIYSIYLAKEHLENAYILEADWILYNQNLIQKYQYSSNYLGIPTQQTNDWCFYVSNKYITKVAIGGQNCHRMVGMSYWTESDGRQLGIDVEKVLHSPGGKERYWDQVPLEYYKNNYKLAIRECNDNDLIEIDTFNELKAIDSSYDM